MSIYGKLGVPTAINAAGPLTRLSGARMSDTVLDAMRDAAGSHVRIEDLQARALEEFVARDHEADRRRWLGVMESLRAMLDGVAGLRCRVLRPEETPRPYPFLRMDIDSSLFGHSAVETVNRLQEGNPRVCVAQWFVDDGAIAVVPTQLAEGDEGVIAERIKLLASAASAP
jgi:hypothetical protein